MKYKMLISKWIFMSMTMILISCHDDILETKIYDEFSFTGDSFNERTAEKLMSGIYANYQMNGEPGRNLIYANDFSGDHMYNEWGGLAKETTYMKNFNWTAQAPSVWLYEHFYQQPYAAIRDVNGLLEVIDNADMSEEKIELMKAEARFIRAHMYDLMYGLFGPVPLRTKSDEGMLGRPTEEEFVRFIQDEIIAVADKLPVDVEKGKVSRGAAYAILMKHYLNQKDWTNTIVYADKVSALNKYELYTEGENPCRDLFKVPNEEIERETVFAFESSNLLSSSTSALMSHSYPSYYYGATVDGSDVKLPNQYISGTKNRIFDFFKESFEPGDLRKQQIIDTWMDQDPEYGQQYAGENRNAPMKYWPDPDADKWFQGHDFRVVRYADVLLSKAEALNENNGPTQESIDLINQVRDRANASLLQLADFSSKEQLRSAILDERGWEFWFEGQRRLDLIRHGEFIKRKRNHPVVDHRVATAEEWRVRFPIPIQEIDVNPLVEQNPGY